LGPFSRIEARHDEATKRGSSASAPCAQNTSLNSSISPLRIMTPRNFLSFAGSPAGNQRVLSRHNRHAPRQHGPSSGKSPTSLWALADLPCAKNADVRAVLPGSMLLAEWRSQLVATPTRRGDQGKRTKRRFRDSGSPGHRDTQQKTKVSITNDEEGGEERMNQFAILALFAAPVSLPAFSQMPRIRPKYPFLLSFLP
jgi:hypothetical protein